ncbi:FAD-binding and (Fe-S)-binding domain-containing protein [Oceanibaculum indicum]|uniref:FAD/FMN-containing dehydrogenase n=1 Tax=Oceanibaculum indicum TaxID=526216 RepID=A0A420WRQ4_9PROT|nr:FAD-binding and (Fe-S)-binding domain-containing protein [Oceanibaculum indicum]RKQ73575.1 FAD/FMN-containing dehydrogenase [Oceanibaculum indicum]
MSAIQPAAKPASKTAASSRKARIAPGDSGLAARLRREVEGDVLFDGFSRGRYSTDASIYQIEPLGVVVPRSEADVLRALDIAREEGVPVLPRGGGTSQCGQTVNEALVIDHSRFLNDVISVNPEARTAWVHPGITLDRLNKQLKGTGLFFPVDISTGSRATIGGMAGNNSCGSRSLRYGNMVHNVRAIDAVLADGTQALFGPIPANLDGLEGNPRYLEIVQKMRALGLREADEIKARIPDILRKIGGYNIETIRPEGHNMASLLVGSEGTLGWFQRIQLDLQPIPPHKALGVCHFPTFRKAMEATKHIVKLGPTAVELVDRTMIDLARDIPAFRETVDKFVVGEPDALLLVEFAGEDKDEQLRGLARLVELMGDLGFPGAVVEAADPKFQSEIWEIRKQGLNIMMSMKGDGKPVSFIEDCAVPLEDLADYTERLTDIFTKYGTKGTWYAHASVGTLHVRPILNMKTEEGAKNMRAIAEEAFAMVREYKGCHSGEHGDGIVRSEFHEPMYGSRIVRAFEEVKDEFDPEGMMNPGKIVRAPKMDDRSLFRFKPGYAIQPLQTALDWSEWGGIGSAVEMCNNNGACRKADPGVMCPSFRATGEEKDVTRGRANSLRLALSGQLGPDALLSDEMYQTMDLCVGCKGCKRECPTGVDMAKMKIEFLHHYRQKHGLRLKDRLVAFLPRYAGIAAKLAPLMNLRDRIPGLPFLTEKLLGLSAKRSLPQWRTDAFRAPGLSTGPADGTAVVLFVDTFNRYFDVENARAAVRVLTSAGYRVHFAAPPEDRPLCCGRTFLAAGLVDEAKAESRRMLDALKPYIDAGVPVLGLEPSCLFTLRDEFRSMHPGAESDALAERAMLLEEFLAAEARAGRLKLELKPITASKALLHGHCHQKAFAAMPAVQQVLKLVPGLTVETIDSSCCGMAGAFGYEAEHYEVSMKMAEASLLPAIRKAEPGVILVADGTSCRHQIHDGASREAVHVVRVLEMALATE